MSDARLDFTPSVASNGRTIVLASRSHLLLFDDHAALVGTVSLPIPAGSTQNGITIDPTNPNTIYAAKAGMDGVCVNEHHQNAYGNMPGPNLMGSVLARATTGTSGSPIPDWSTTSGWTTPARCGRAAPPPP